MFKKRNVGPSEKRKKVVSSDEEEEIKPIVFKKVKKPVDAQRKPKIRTEITSTDQDKLVDSSQAAVEVKKESVSGPKPLSNNVKVTMAMDYQPDVCKDFRQTGFCGYGDSCKFLHSRDDFKAGWTLKTDWKVGQVEKLVEKNVPFKCVLCKNDYKSPVVTKCGHYFCEKCFLKRSKTNTTCFVCGEDTHGSAKPTKLL